MGDSRWKGIEYKSIQKRTDGQRHRKRVNLNKRMGEGAGVGGIGTTSKGSRTCEFDLKKPTINPPQFAHQLVTYYKGYISFIVKDFLLMKRCIFEIVHKTERHTGGRGAGGGACDPN